MSFLLDTNIGSSHLRTPSGLSHRFFQHIDLMIASVALVHQLTLVTHNTADFRHIPNLRLDDWLVP